MMAYVITLHDFLNEDSEIDSVWTDHNLALGRLETVRTSVNSWSNGDAILTTVELDTTTEIFWGGWSCVSMKHGAIRLKENG